MTFRNVSLPSDFQMGSAFGAGFATVVSGSASGHERRVARQAQPRHRFRLVKALQSQSEALALKEFAIQMRGSWASWRLKDSSDHTTATDGTSTPQATDFRMGSGDGTTKTFQLGKAYAKNLDGELRDPITLPIDGTVVVALDGITQASGWTVTNPGGIVTFTTAPALGVNVTAGCEFERPARFETSLDDWMALSATSFQNWQLSLDAIQVLNEVENPERWEPGGSHNLTTGDDFAISLAEEACHNVENTNASTISALLPQPPSGFQGGLEILALHNKSTSAGSIQPRDDAGNAIGGAITAGSFAVFDAAVTGSTVTWLRRT